MKRAANQQQCAQLTGCCEPGMDCHHHLTPKSPSECAKCNGTVVSVYEWASARWIQGQMQPLTWKRRVHGPVNQWIQTPEFSLLFSYINAAVSGRVAQAVAQSMICRFKAVSSFLGIAACNCGVNINGADCGANLDTSVKLAQQTVPCGVAVSVAGVTVPASTSCNQSAQLSVSAQPTSALASGSSSGKSVLHALVLPSRFKFHYETLVQSAHRGYGFPVRSSTPSAAACYASVINSYSAIIGQLRGDCVVFTSSQTMYGVQICMTVKSSISWDSTLYPVAGVAVLTKDSQNNNVYTAQSTAVSVSGTQMCLTLTSSSGGTYCPVSLMTNFAAQTVTSPGTCAANTIIQQVQQVQAQLVAGATKLAFTLQPTSGVAAGTALPTFAVAFQDANGNTVSSAAASVSLNIMANTGTSGATLGGTITVSAVSGVASFTDITLSASGTAYTLVAQSGSLSNAQSQSINVAAGAASAVSFTQQLAGCVASQTCLQQPKVSIVDASGNAVTTATHSVTLTAYSGVTAVSMTGTATVAAVNGVATFTNLGFASVASSYSLSATASQLVSATSSSFNVVSGVSTAVKLAFSTQPASAMKGSAFGVQPVVAVQDVNGNTVSSAANVVTLTISSPTGSTAVLSGGVATAIAGVTTFTNAAIDSAGNYILTASATGLAGATTSSFLVNGVKDLAFQRQPSGALVNTALNTQPQVVIRDVNGATMTSRTDAITLSILSGSGASGANLAGTIRLSAVAGVATFTDLSVDKAGTNYIFVAVTDDGVTGQSTAYTITAAAVPSVASSSSGVSITVIGAAIGGGIGALVIGALFWCYSRRQKSHAKAQAAADQAVEFSTTSVCLSKATDAQGNVHSSKGDEGGVH